MILRQILATAALGGAFLGTPVAAVYLGIGAGLAVFYGGVLLAGIVAFWPTRRRSR